MKNLRIDLFPVGSFPGVLQEVIVLSGQANSGFNAEAKVTVFDHATQLCWVHAVDEGLATWTGLLLTPHQMAAIEEARELPGVTPLGQAARIGVSTVTGANEFFSLDEQTRRQFKLENWCRPLLARSRHVKGLDFTCGDFEANVVEDLPVWLFDSGMTDIDPISSPGPRRYIKTGSDSALDLRYKCRIRKPWYRVPVVEPRAIMLSKRCHRFPRLILNSVGATTTDTIYQGSLVGEYQGREMDVVASFHNSLTLASAELFGRSFGGGVLELVPSEVKSLLVPVVSVTRAQFGQLDRLVRVDGCESHNLVDATDELVAAGVPGLQGELLSTIREARESLLRRRLERN